MINRTYLSLEESWPYAWLLGFNINLVTAAAHERFIEWLETD